MPEPRRTVEKERVVGLAGQLGHGERGRVREAAARADHEAVEGVRWVDRERLGDGPLAGTLPAGRLTVLGFDQDDPLDPGG